MANANSTNPPIIQTTDLSRNFDQIKAVNKLNLSVSSGSVYGFLGPNGSGKTTTIRMLLGLIKPDSGSVNLFGSNIATNLNSALQKVGSMVEYPSLYGHLTGYENLEINRVLCNLPKSSIDRVLQITNMTDSAKRLTKQYSLGMKQRLGLALALIAEPELLILDEPTNGLDPAGIREIRELICSLPQKTGLTVFLSSHMLNEVQLMANQVGIVSSGSLLFQGSMQELQLAHKPHIEIEVGQVELALVTLKGAGFNPTHIKDNKISIAHESKSEDNTSANSASEIAKLLVQNQIDLFQLKKIELSLEELFLTMTETNGEEA